MQRPAWVTRRVWDVCTSRCFTTNGNADIFMSHGFDLSKITFRCVQYGEHIQQVQLCNITLLLPCNVALAVSNDQFTDWTNNRLPLWPQTHNNDSNCAMVTLLAFRKVFHTLKRYFKLKGVSKGTRVIQDSHIQHLYLRHCFCRSAKKKGGGGG